MSDTFPRVVVIVLDSVGIGELPDAGRYGDEGSNTLGNIARHVPLRVPTLRTLGLSRVADIGSSPEDGTRIGAYGRLAHPGQQLHAGYQPDAGLIRPRPSPVEPCQACGI